ncbi:MAG: hypothetical protein B7C55_00785 [Actinomycetales bacterium mxb001]|nr:MAG: hypothetical protein B7C55_00785 [Actinomycetales bacterium mxb001]
MQQSELEHYERQLSTLLGVWAAGSVIKGGIIALIGHRTGRKQWMRFGRQNAMWGAVDGVIAGLGVRSRSRRGELTPEQVEFEATKLRVMLLLNALADVVYIAGGAHIAYHAKPGPPEVTSFKMGRGDGVAIVIQGAFLLGLDLTFARRLSAAS